jgi:hypothetical protein
MGPGILSLYFIGADDTRALMTSWTLTLESGQQSDFLPLPDPPHGFKGYVVVYRGPLGAEADAVVGQMVDPFPGAYLFYMGHDIIGPIGAQSDTDGRSGASPVPTPVSDGDFFGFVWKYALGDWREDSRWWPYFYRALSDSPGDVLRLTPLYPEGTGCQAADYAPATGEPSVTSIGAGTVKVFELQTPVRVADLEYPGFTFTSPPVKVRTLATITATWGMEPVGVDVRGVRFIGLEVLTEPPAPTPTPGGQATICYALWKAAIVQPSENP